MIEARDAFLSMYARPQPDGLVVIDGGFVTRVWDAEPPIRRTLYLVANLFEESPGADHTFALEVNFAEDAERVALLEGQMRIDSQEPMTVLLPFYVELRRAGSYSVSFRIDAVELRQLPLAADFRL